jgi:glycosyltransferase involved in cell wall biosynthesis
MSAAPVPVLLVESGRVRGGTERVVDALARGLDREHFQPWVVIEPRPALDEWADDLRRDGVPVVRRAEITNRLQWGRAAGWFRFLRRRRRALLHVHHVYSSADRYLVPLAHLAGVRAVVITEHIGARPHSGGQRWLKRWELSRADVPVAVSRSVAGVLSEQYGLAPELIEVVPNGVPAPRALAPGERARLRAAWGVPERARLWLTVGRLEDQKGIDILLDAWAALPAPRPYLAVVGGGSRLAALEAQARALDLSERVRFVGVVPEARAVYGAADGFVLASRFEGMPLALLESMAAALPVVATAVAGVGEVADAETARLVPPLDARALAAAVAALEGDPVLARTLGERAAARVAERFGDARMVDAYEAIYRRALRLIESLHADEGEEPEAP